MSIPKTSKEPDAELLLSLDKPRGRACLLTKKMIDDEFKERHRLLAERFKTYGDALIRYYRLEAYQKSRQVPEDITKFFRKEATMTTLEDEIRVQEKECISRRLRGLHQQAVKHERACLPFSTNADQECFTWFHQHLYHERVPDGFLIGTETRVEYEKICRQQGQDSLIEYFKNLFGEFTKTIHTLKNETIRRADRERQKTVKFLDERAQLTTVDTDVDSDTLLSARNKKSHRSLEKQVKDLKTQLKVLTALVDGVADERVKTSKKDKQARENKRHGVLKTPRRSTTREPRNVQQNLLG